MNSTANYNIRKEFSVSIGRIRGDGHETEVVVYEFGKQLTYECEHGYVFHHTGGNSELHITCEENGVWRGQVSDCLPIECPVPPAFEYGWVTLKTQHGDTLNSRRQSASDISNDGIVYVYGSEIEVSCALGYRLVGPDVRECLANGKWSSAEPHCDQVTCDLSMLVLFSDPPTPIAENGVFNVSGNFYGDLADFVCKPGYRLTLPMFSHSWSLTKLTWTCQMNGSWVLFNNIDTGSEFMDAVVKRGQALCQPFQYKCPEPTVRALKCYNV